MKFGSTIRVWGASGAAILCLIGAALAGQARPQQTPPLAEDVFKNVPALRGISVDEFMDTMGMFAASLNMNCTDCHTEDSGSSWDNFAKETPLKQMARRMILMVNNLNRNNFGGERRVTCYTCHRGDPRPKVVPSLAVQYGVPVEDPNSMEIFSDPQAPPVDEIFGRYIEAVGGAERVAGLTSFAATGTYVGYDTEQLEVPVEVFAKAPNQRTTIVHTMFGDSVRVYDGNAGWIAAPDKPLPLMPLTRGNLAGARTDAIVTFPTRIQQAFSQWRIGSTVIDDRDVRVVQGTTDGAPPVNFYFDETGLLVRVVHFSETPVGTVPTQIDFDDYRDVSGIKMPFRWTATWTNGQSTTQLTDLQLNVPIDMARFARPAPAPVPR